MDYKAAVTLISNLLERLEKHSTNEKPFWTIEKITALEKESIEIARSALEILIGGGAQAPVSTQHQALSIAPSTHEPSPTTYSAASVDPVVSAPLAPIAIVTDITGPEDKETLPISSSGAPFVQPGPLPGADARQPGFGLNADLSWSAESGPQSKDKASPLSFHSRPSQTPYALKLEQARLDPRNVEPDVLLCIDFGTARSKAFATRKSPNGVERLRLAIGDRANDSAKFTITSSALIDNSGIIHLGHRAVNLSIGDPALGRRRIDSLKEALTQADFTADGEIVDPARTLLNQFRPESNPTNVSLTEGDVLLLYLGYLTSLAERELSEVHRVRGYAKRRFALPSWETKRRDSGSKLLTGYLARAQVVADSLDGEWAKGIDVVRVKELLDQVNNLPLTDLPCHLIGEGVLEPVAAGGSLLKKLTPQRELVMVVDVGAGTTDFAAFLVTENPNIEPDGVYKMTLLASDCALQAGDKIDQLLQIMLVDRAHLVEGSSQRKRSMAALDHRKRGLKEALFNLGHVQVELLSGETVKVTREEFLATPGMKGLESHLEERFEATLMKDPETVGSFKAQGVTVVLTGGGAMLPMVKRLGENFSKGGIRRKLAPQAPPWLQDDEELKNEYPQLAVAIGGAQPELPQMGKEVGPIDLSLRQSGYPHRHL